MWDSQPLPIMKYKLAFLSLIAISAAMASVTSGDVARHKAWMDTSQDLKDEIRDALSAQSGAKAAHSAQKLTNILRQEEQYWINAKQSDAAKLARQNLAESRQIAAWAKSGDLNQALRAFNKLEETCSACHDLHPEKRLSLNQDRSHAYLVAVTQVHATAFPLHKARSSRAPKSSSILPRTHNGNPDLSGIWQVLNTADWDIQGHQAQTGVPAGQGVVEGDEIPYQSWALAKKKENFETRATADPEAKCYVPGVPRLAYMPFPFQITQTSDQLTILSEYAHTVRVIFTNGSTHPPGHIDWWLGDSRAHWQGDTLVVDVTDFNDQTWFDRAGNFHSDALHVVERYTPVDADHINYEATIEDPKVFTRPWKLSFVLYRHKEKNFQLLEYECFGFDLEKYYP